MSSYSPAQKRAYAAKMSKMRAKTSTYKKSYTPRTSNYVPKSYTRKKGFGERVGGFLGEGADHVWDNVSKAWDDVGKPMAKGAIMGFGNYVQPNYPIKRNSLIGMGKDPPMIKNTKDGSFIIRHREYLQDIITGTPGQFINNSFKIQPGLQASFPWLSLLSQSFEQYQLRGMIFEFKSTSADALNSTNTALGEVILATEYDSSKPNFTSKIQMENHQYATTARQSCSVIHPIECSPSVSTLKTQYIRTGAVPANSSAQMYDFGNFQIATVGQQGVNVNIGTLWVTYEVRLLKCNLPNIGNLVFSSYYQQPIAGSVSSTNFFGTQAYASQIQYSLNNTIGMRLNVTSMDFPSYLGNGTYLVSIIWQGQQTIGVTVPTVSPTANSGLVLDATVSPFNGTPPVFQTPLAAQTTDSMSLTFLVFLGTAVPGTPRRLTFSGGNYPNTCTAQLYITSAQSGLSASSLATGYTVPVNFNVLRLPGTFETPKGPLQLMSEQAGVRAEIQRLRAVLKADDDAHQEFEDELEQIDDDDDDEDDDDEKEGYLNGIYTPKSLKSIASDISNKVTATPSSSPNTNEGEWEDMSKSTINSIQAIVERAKVKKALLDKQ